MKGRYWGDSISISFRCAGWRWTQGSPESSGGFPTGTRASSGVLPAGRRASPWRAWPATHP